MLKIENTETYGWEAAVRGMRNPKNSWDKSDSKFYHDVDCGSPCNCSQCDIFGNECGCYYVGKNDLELMKKLAAAGNDHGKFMRMITVTCDIVAPFYWWKEFDTYKIGTVADSCSTMHKIADKNFTLKDFSCEHLNKESLAMFKRLVKCLEANRQMYLALDNDEAKEAWWQMIQLLPSSYNQRRTVQMNYAVLKNMYHARKNHKLDEWHTFCDWVETLPYSELICGDKK